MAEQGLLGYYFAALWGRQRTAALSAHSFDLVREFGQYTKGDSIYTYGDIYT